MAYLGKQPAEAALVTGDLGDDIVTLAKLAGGTDGNIISFDASGNPVAIATGSDGQVLTSAGAGAQPAFEAGGLATPADFVSSNQTMTADTVLDVAHSLGSVPALFQVLAKCITTDQGYPVNSLVNVTSHHGAASDVGLVTYCDATNVTIVRGGGGGMPDGWISESSKNDGGWDASKWKFVVYAWA